MNNTKKTNNIRFLAKLLSVILLLSVIVVAFSSCLSFKHVGTTVGKDELQKNIAELGEQDLGYEYVCYYLQDYGIRNFDDYKFALIEAYFESYYYKELPEKHVHAKETAELFVEYYYDAINLQSTEETTDALLYCYSVASGDPYAFYRNAEEYEAYTGELRGESTVVGIGVRVLVDYQNETILVSSVIRDSGAWDAGILPGDYIIGADGVTIKDDGTDAVMNAIPGKEGTNVKVTLLRKDAELSFSIERAVIPDVSVFYTVENNIATVQIVEFNGNTAAQFKKAIDEIKKTKVEGIIFDLRNNPGGLLNAVVDVIDYIAPDGKRIASYNATMEGEKIFTADDGHSYTDVPMVVLCNGYTASAGELFTAAIRDYNDMGLIEASIVGSTTYGKGVMQSSIPLNDGSALTLTVAYYNPPCDSNYEGVGITPDVKVESADTSVQMEKAKEELDAILRGEGNNTRDPISPDTQPGDNSDVNSNI